MDGTEWGGGGGVVLDYSSILTSSLADLSWRGGVAGDAWLSRSGRTLLVRWPGVPRLLFSPPTRF